ncbi:MAG: flagellar hook-associated protein 3 [Deltaproteobacteria bacterium]|nr:MAG: flagellar hook-associated protein 3 [Deltaproteobacteria bacterium]
MRVSEQQLFGQLARAVAAGWARLARVQRQVATGVRVASPADDPVAAARVGALDETLRRLDQADAAARSATASLEASEAALGEANSLVIRARELAVQAASEQYSAADRAAVADEVQALRQQMLALANTEVGGSYLFAGARNDQVAFDAAGNYQGDANEPELEVAPGLRVAVVLSGDRVFGAAGGTDVLATLDNLQQALNADDTAAIQSSLDQLDAAGRQLVSARAEAGARLELVAAAGGWCGRLRNGVLTDRGRVRDTDLAGASMQLALAQKALEAAVASVAKVVEPDLLGRL